jgi:KEOPS complex subunit Cgi121
VIPDGPHTLPSDPFAPPEVVAVRLVEGIATVDDLDAFLADLDTVAAETGCTVQAFDARYVADRAHLRRAVDLADRAIRRGENVARERGVEILLYAAGRRQIDRALTMGVAEGTHSVVVLVDAPDPDVAVATDDGVDASRTDGERTVTERESAAANRVRDRLDPADTLGAYDPDRVRAFFDVSDRELAATDGDLVDLVRERVALLDVAK